MKRQLILILGAILFWVPSSRAVYTSARQLLDKSTDWYKSDEAARHATNILSYQSPLGGFPKNIDTGAEPYTGDPKELKPTFDNSATTDELRYLARMYDATKDEKYKTAFLKGLDYILKAQYENGGWPQSYPPGRVNYDKYITFNDGAMARLMFFLKEVAADQEHYGFVDEARRSACLKAWDKGVDCILKCQIKVDGKLTAWCQQHDEKDFSPRPARAFEPVALTACETVGLCHVLMSIEHPTAEEIAAVDAAVAWMDAVKIPGIKVVDTPDESAPHHIQRAVVKDPSAPPMWARYYEIGTNKPIYMGRDSVVKYDLADVELERRTGYQWLKYWPRDLLEKDYPKWKAKLEK